MILYLHKGVRGMEVKLRKQPQKYLDRLQPRLYDKLNNALRGLEDWEGDIIGLAGRKNEYRLKIPPYRIIFSYAKGEDIITVTKIDTRGDAYKKG
jgi:mRNA-degrading endonuclease RelE of RelBE toxin-antitoxin system